MRAEHLDAVALLALGLVHRELGVAEHHSRLLARRALGAAVGEGDADGAAQQVARSGGKLDRRLDRVEDEIGTLHGVVHGVDVLDEEREPVAADARQGVARVATLGQAARIYGVTPAALSALRGYVKKARKDARRGGTEAAE